MDRADLRSRRVTVRSPARRARRASDGILPSRATPAVADLIRRAPHLCRGHGRVAGLPGRRCRAYHPADRRAGNEPRNRRCRAPRGPPCQRARVRRRRSADGPGVCTPAHDRRPRCRTPLSCRDADRHHPRPRRILGAQPAHLGAPLLRLPADCSAPLCDGLRPQQPKPVASGRVCGIG